MSRVFSKRRRVDAIVHRKSHFNMQNKHKVSENKKVTKHDLKVKCRRLKEEMKEISNEQKIIKEGQSLVREKIKALEMECELLQKETKFMIQRSAFTQLRLALMFNILKARKEADHAKAAKITQLLRELIARDNMQQQTWRKKASDNPSPIVFKRTING